MPETLGLDAFCRYLREQHQAIGQVYREIEEVQYQFNEFYRQKLALWEGSIARAVPLLTGDGELPPALARMLLTAIDQERARLEGEIADLAARVEERRATADRAIAQAQAEVAALRQMNPQLNAEEEERKARAAAIGQTIQELSAEIKSTNPLTGLFRRRRLAREREAERAALAQEKAQLRRVRQTWEDEKKRAQENQSRLHGEWEAASVEAAQLQARLDYLQANLAPLSRQRGVAGMLAGLESVPDCADPLRSALTEMVDLNRVKSEYEEGLRTVAEALGLLKGVAEGMERFRLSADKVLEEQEQYNLRALHVRLDDEVLRFHALWPQFRGQVKDEKMLGTHPAEFSRRVQGLLGGHLTEQAIAAMFERMGDALTQATRAWG